MTRTAGEAGREPSQPYLLVVGCPRSGTTLLQRMLDNNPQLAVSNDTRAVPWSQLRRLENPALTSDLVDAIVSFKRFPRFGISAERAREIASGATALSDFLAALFSEYARLQHKPLSGEKTPDYVRHLPVLLHLFPWGRVVHVVRDGRDVALSMLTWAGDRRVGPSKFYLWRDEPVATCALFWGWHVSMGMKDGRDLGPRSYHWLKYEDLVQEPEATLREVCNFLALPYAPEMLEYHRGRQRHKKSLSAKSAWLPPTPGLRDWRTQMAAPDVELFEALAGDLITTLGYPRAGQETSAATARRADRCRARWEEEMARQHPWAPVDRVRTFI
jgi:hypothetical protein